MIEDPSAAPTCTVIPATWRFRDGAGEGGWKRVRPGEPGSSGRQVGDKVAPLSSAWRYDLRIMEPRGTSADRIPWKKSPGTLFAPHATPATTKSDTVPS